jgi:NAD(P)-dependent dehydrogenase (short-subunit alcohol dehydrogenase family)
MSRLNGKIALVTGAAMGMGQAFANAMAAEGATVILADINAAAGEQAAAEITASGGRAEFVELDVTSEAGWNAVAEAVGSRHGRLDVLVNNAGIAAAGSVEDCELDAFNRTMNINVTGVFLGCKLMLPLLKQSDGGSIINISSIFGMVGDEAAVAYNASKGAVRTLTKSAALHCATLEPKVRVNSVHPGFVETPMVAKAVASLPEDYAAEYMARTVGRVPLGRIGQPDDLAGIVLFLAADESRYCTGSEFVVDGGFTAH